MRRLVIVVFAVMLAGGLVRTNRTQAADHLNGHDVVLDDQGRLLSWISPQSAAYGEVVRLAWNRMKGLRSSGQKTYLHYSTFDPQTFEGGNWPHNPAGLYAMLTESAAEYYAFAGDKDVVNLVQEAIDYQLSRGLTPLDWSWSGVPYASADPGAAMYEGAANGAYGGDGVGDGRGVIEPDKVGEFGFACLRLYELTGDVRYRDAAINDASALAAHVRVGNSSTSPWPFRVLGRTNEVRENYTANVIGAIELFDELIRLSLGDTAVYQSTRQLAWQWLMDFPMRNNLWSGYFEDVPVQNDPAADTTQYIPMQTASYLISHPEFDPDGGTHVPALLGWVEQRFAGDARGMRGVLWGATTISEQGTDMAKMGSHTSRFAAVNALWAEAARDSTARNKAFRSFNWSTYMADDSGLVTVTPDGSEGYWFSDGYGDYIRHFLIGMGAVPEWAPLHENHLLRSSSVVQSVSYSPVQVTYQTFDSSAVDVLRLVFQPTRVIAGDRELMPGSALDDEGYVLQPLDNGDWIVRIRHVSAGDIQVLAQ